MVYLNNVIIFCLMECILGAMLRIMVQRHCCSQVIILIKYYVAI